MGQRWPNIIQRLHRQQLLMSVSGYVSRAGEHWTIAAAEKCTTKA